ncbi:transporter substrate-binding domain-containing protein [Longimycelium tulufanense]|uniref:transporter substrate-binding domain-containing protein n=1 Tax=Longimycelium tulufanense TaxID=907463 RepID=UPI00166C8F47|nr:transporter substrate-binding domain-containing protein [Longimycelium tulufanense]
MRLRVLVITLALLFGTALTSAAGPAPSPASRLEAVTSRGEVRVCSTGDYRPFTHLEDGNWSGIDVEMAQDLGRRLGVRVTMVPTTWKTLLDDFVAKCDMAVGGVSVTLDRARRAFFSDAYLVDGKTPITRCENGGRFGTLDEIDQPGVRVIVNPGGTNERFVRSRLTRATIVTHPDNTTIFDEIVAGRADLMITDAVETRYQAKLHPELCPVHPDKPFTYVEKAYLLPRGDVIFQQWVNHWLSIARHDGTYDGIVTRWLG